MLTNLLKVRYLAVATILSSTLLLTGCQAQLSDYDNTTPNLKYENYFQGPMVAWGMVQDYQGKVTRRFCVEMTGTWQNNTGVLAETFYFDDGEVSYRNWQLTKVANDKYIGEAEDVIGEASGTVNGFAGKWQYTLSLDVGESNYHFALDDWLYQLDEYRAFNKAKMKKFGITVAELTLFFDKQTPLRTCDKKGA
ncbi:DUF3833 domain-containing protein [Thalassotalea sp. LPB0316]|uniref:DUF3833 domain-containing protein n=1 Tax=Thalassotalea sp. LPB0316 TaxID=2769490 RepID=UPI001866DDFC|nr:DUF3833 domain-containing protein [Thalassotalea sp. LPB0316]QOL25551.1 DUF3833 domain-containing protein [Thalassotalea sp. LPB0316]